LKRFMIPRTAHCSSGCHIRSRVRRETARITAGRSVYSGAYVSKKYAWNTGVEINNNLANTYRIWISQPLGQCQYLRFSLQYL